LGGVDGVATLVGPKYDECPCLFAAAMEIESVAAGGMLVAHSLVGWQQQVKVIDQVLA
jgi:hypothetical protein